MKTNDWKYFEDIEINKPMLARPYTISKEEIVEFARLWDPRPFHTCEEAAREWPLGFSASGIQTFAISIRDFVSNPNIGLRIATVAGLGFDEIRIMHAVRPGDTLTVRGTTLFKRESQSKPDLGIVTSHIEVLNQKEDIVFHYKMTVLVAKKHTKGRKISMTNDSME